MYASFLNKLAESKRLDKHIRAVMSDPTKMVRALVIANVLKDTVGMFFYVYQSYNNQKIPEEKRKLVSALDFANGLAMIGLQLLFGFTITSKVVQEMITRKLFGSLEHTDLKRFQKCQKGFSAITSLLITAIIAKRIFTPLVTTPMAFKIKEKYIDKKENQTHFNVEQLSQFNPEVVYKLGKSKLNFTAYPSRYGNPISITNSGDKLKI